MAKPKGVEQVGWSTHPTYSAGITILTEWDVNQSKNRKRGMSTTYSAGHQPRQIGLAKMERTYEAGKPWYALYSHSQVSNGASFRYQPPAYVGMTREDLERLWVTIGKELFSGEEE